MKRMAATKGKQKKAAIVPRAREEGLLIKEVSDETLVYDLRSHKVHCLNDSAAVVWRHCDGRRSVSELEELFRDKFDAAVAGEVVWSALDRLQKAHLLQEPTEIKAPPSSRRQLIKKLAKLGLAAPVIVSIVSPTAVQAATLISRAQCRSDPAAVGQCCTNNRICRLRRGRRRCRGAAC